MSNKNKEVVVGEQHEPSEDDDARICENISLLTYILFH